MDKEELKHLDKDFLELGMEVYTNEHIEKLRKQKSMYNIIAQKGSQELFLADDTDVKIFGGKRGGSKGQPYDAKVITPFGFKLMGDLEVGSKITDTNGQAQSVLAIYELGERDVYKINFVDGVSCECTEDHLWLVHKTCATDKKNHLDINGNEESFKGRFFTTKMIIDFLDKKDSSNNPTIKLQNLIIPLCEPVRFTRSYKGDMRHIPPYVLGAILGDGSITLKQACTFTSIDQEILDNIQCYGDEYKLKLINDGRNMNYRFVGSVELSKHLDKLNLKGKSSIDKFIPEHYKYDTVEHRKELLQGLMDTDGTVDERGHLSYSTISKQLADDVAWLVRSLGGKATISKDKAGYKDENGVYIQCNDVYDIYINTKFNKDLFRLQRKKDRAKNDWFNGGVSELGRRIISYEYAGKKQSRCIQVDNPNSLYLTEDFIVTHNTYSLLLEALNDVNNPYFFASLLRKEKEDSRKTGGMIDKSDAIFTQYGVYNKSQQDMTWNFANGGKLKFDYYSDGFEDFKKRFQGLELSYIGVDEITHMQYAYFKYLLTCNRNAHDLKNRFVGTCNPDPDSWVAEFIDWWIDEDGYPIPERNGVVRYCFMYGDTVNEIYWGDTKNEVYLQAQDRIDKLWKKEYDKFGSKEDMFIKSVTFIEGKLEENVKLLESDPAYLANLANQSEEQVARDLDGNWKFKTAGIGLISFEDIEEKLCRNSHQVNGRRCVTCDVAFEGGDKCVFWYWEGFHARALRVCAVDAQKTVEYAKEFLKQHNVLEQDFCYDVNGLGQVFKGYMPNAIPFNNKAMPSNGDRSMFENLKAECAYRFIENLKARRYSIDPMVLTQKHSGKGYKNNTVKAILLNERKAIARDETDTDKNWRLISKAEMKKNVGHSPDFIESFFMREYFELTKKHVNRSGAYYL